MKKATSQLSLEKKINIIAFLDQILPQYKRRCRKQCQNVDSCWQTRFVFLAVPWSDDPGEIVKRALDWGRNPMYMQTSNPPGALYSSLGKCLYSDGESRATTKDFGVVAGATLDDRKY